MFFSFYETIKLAILEESREKWKAEALLSRKQPKESEHCNKITPPETVKKDLIPQTTPLNAVWRYQVKR